MLLGSRRKDKQARLSLLKTLSAVPGLCFRDLLYWSGCAVQGSIVPAGQSPGSGR